MEILFTRGNVFDFVLVDSTVIETHNESSVPTEHPVEDGVNLTDHVKPERDRLTVECVVSNTPVTSPDVNGATGAVTPVSQVLDPIALGQFTAGAQGGQGAKPARWTPRRQTLGANVLQFPAEFDRVGLLYEKLSTCRREALPLTIVTSLRTYDRMLLVAMTSPRESKWRHAVKFTLEFIEYRAAETLLVDEPLPLESRADRARSRGQQGTEDQGSEVDNRTFARRVAERILGDDAIEQIGNGQRDLNGVWESLTGPQGLGRSFR